MAAQPDIGSSITKDVVFSTVRRYLERKALIYTTISPTLVKVAFSDSNVFFTYSEQVSVLYIMHQSPEKIPVEHRPNIPEVMVRANYGLRIGQMDFDESDGEVRYCASVCCRFLDPKDLPDQVDLLFTHAMAVYERYIKAVRDVIAGTPAKEAVRRAEAGLPPARAGQQSPAHRPASASGDSDAGGERRNNAGAQGQAGALVELMKQLALLAGLEGPAPASPANAAAAAAPAIAPAIAPAAAPARPDEKGAVRGGGNDIAGDMGQMSLFTDGFVPMQNLEINWSEQDKLGEGGFGKVFKARMYGMPVAVKVLTTMASGDRVDSAVSKMFEKEITLQRKLNNPRILQVIGVSSYKGKWLLITEFCQNKSLRDYMRDKKAEFDVFDNRRRIALQTAQGMAYLHDKNIAHLDLKPENLLIDEDGNVRVADFGLSKVLTHTFASSRAGGFSPLYVAPEVIDGGHQYNKQADIYSFGIVLYELLCRKLPYSDKARTPWALIGAVQSGLRPALPPNIHPAHRALLEACWHQDPNARPSFIKICSMIKELPPG